MKHAGHLSTDATLKILTTSKRLQILKTAIPNLSKRWRLKSILLNFKMFPISFNVELKQYKMLYAYFICVAFAP